MTMTTVRSMPFLLGGAALLLIGRLAAQTPVADIPYESAPNLFKMPAAIHLGEAAGVATNSKGHVFVYTRTGSPTAAIGNSRIFTHDGARLFEFDQNGVFVREI